MTVEPGIYIALTTIAYPPQVRGIGVRIEGMMWSCARRLRRFLTAVVPKDPE